MTRARFVDLAATAGALAGLIGLGWLVGIVVGHPGVDETITRWFVDHRSHALTTFFRSVTGLGAATVLAPLVLSASLVLALVGQRSRRVVVTPLLALLGTTVISQAVKHAVGRDRPDVLLRAAHAGGFAFPSGHAIESIAVWGAVCILLSTLVDGAPRVAIRVAGAAVVVAVGLSRLYLGVHWMTDVLAGWLLGGAWLAVVLRRVDANTSPTS